MRLDKVSMSAIFFAVTFLLICSSSAVEQKETRVVDSRNGAQAADAMFRERCKTAGEKIHRTVENVEGVLLMKLRPKGLNYGDQFRMDDPYGRDFGGDDYIKSFLRGDYEAGTKGTPIPGSPAVPIGYFFVEIIGPDDGKRYRYTGGVKEVTRKTTVLMGGDGKTTFKAREFVADRELSVASPPRYGVTYDDISTKQEREHWIAGSSLKVVDLASNEVIAERVGYMLDRGQGSNSGGRAPWLFAANNACPSFLGDLPNTSGHAASMQGRQTVRFVQKVLRPKLEK